ncbi:MAG TPA: DUF6496 domain-containing protein [Candidatus Didemnitutus sp.]|nr:DUF6496 domain-containing protein [Candidatus Didemnitutus sp.]
MAKRSPLQRARRDARQGKSASTQAGEYVRDEIERVRSGKHGARSTKQMIAIGLSRARRAGVDLPAPKSGSKRVRQQAAHDRQNRGHPPSRKRSQATLRALQREGSSAASSSALSRQARQSARRRGSGARRQSTRRAARAR